MPANSISGRETRYVVPALQGIYSSLDQVAWLVLRLTTGLLLMPHGAQKLFGAFGGGGISGTAQFLEKVGYSMPATWATLIALIEFFGGLCLALGLFTRPVAIAIFIFLVNAALFHSAFGFFWTDKGFEYPMLWAVAALFFAIKGGGPLSLDRKIGREL